MRHRLPLALVFAALTQAIFAQTIQVNKENKTIAITATDSAETEADTADITIGYTLYGTAQDTTYAEASRVSNQIVKVLTDAGLKRDQIRSTEQNLSPLQQDDKPRFEKGLRFVASQTWKVTTKAANAAEALNLAINAGANNSGGIDWRLADDNALEAEAARKALTHAQQIAERMAGGLHAKLGPLVYASNQVPQRNFFGAVLQTESASMTRVLNKTPVPLAILPDKVSRSATVYAVFAIE
jgi:uncharacterized protein YggE